MRSLSCSVLLLLGAAGLAAPSPVLPKTFPAPAGSFLRARVSSVAQLVRQVQADPAVRGRYAHYFGIPPARVADYLRQNLTARALPQAGPYTVFFVAGSGLVYPARLDLRPGTRVFARRDGRPVLLRDTGDPLKPFATPVETRIISAPPTVRVGGTVEQLAPASPTDIPVPAATP